MVPSLMQTVKFYFSKSPVCCLVNIKLESHKNPEIDKISYFTPSSTELKVFAWRVSCLSISVKLTQSMGE